MKRFFRFYQQLCIANVGRTLANRMDFLHSVFSSLLWSGFSIVAIFAITQHSVQVAGWSQGEILLLALTYSIIVGWFHIFFSRNFPTAANVIHYGELDRLLIKPISSLLLLIGSEINFAATVRPILSIGFIWFVIVHYHLPVTVFSVIAFFLLSFVGLAILVSIHIVFTTILLYHSNLSNIMDFGALMVSASRYPIDSLRYAPTIAVLLFLPVMAAVNIPTKVLIEKASTQDVFLFVGTAVVFLSFSLWWWRHSLVRYTGASG
ncbi:MAG: ABC-2 family transporter protein [Candidatus Woesebacteria bacterium]